MGQRCCEMLEYFPMHHLLKVAAELQCSLNKLSLMHYLFTMILRCLWIMQIDCSKSKKILDFRFAILTFLSFQCDLLVLVG